jgi:hypothetical protein
MVIKFENFSSMIHHEVHSFQQLQRTLSEGSSIRIVGLFCDETSSN